METFNVIAGDILMYSDNTFSDRVIQWATKGKFNHCAVAINEHQMIEAISIYGVKRSSIFKPDLIIPSNPTISIDKINMGISFLRRRIGSSYGVLDIALDAFLAIVPKRFSNTPILIAPSMFSCSHLVVLYLMVIGQSVPDNWILCPESISPNEIARYFNTK